MDKKAEIKELWSTVMAIISGSRSGNEGYVRTSSPISQKTVSEFINSVATLQESKPEELVDDVEKVRGQAQILQAVGRFGASDLERINALLDKIV
jgi:hypothetical protein